MFNKTNLVALMSALVISAPVAIAKDVKEPPAPGSGVAGDNAKAILAGNLYADGKRKYDAKDFAGALERFNTVVQLDAKSLGGFYYRGLTQKKLGKADAAKKDFKKATGMTATTAEEFDIRGKAYEECGQKAQAQADFAKAKSMSKSG